MTEKQKSEIIRMRENGVSFSKISEVTGVSRNTIKSFCRRVDTLAQCTEVTEVVKPVQTAKTEDGLNCKQCGKPLQIVPGRKTPKFCCKDCRTKWWNSHPEEVNKKAIYNFTCAGCGKAFTAYGNNGRKYCSHGCYITARFGGGSDE